MPESTVPPFYPVLFSFEVVVTGISDMMSGSFQEVSGINVKLDTETIKEGGENRFSHRLPNPPKYDNLILKRGMVLDSALIVWARAALEKFTFTPKSVIVNLLDEAGKPLASWSFVNAYPVALKVSDFKAQENAIVIETLELAYDYFTRLK